MAQGKRLALVAFILGIIVAHPRAAEGCTCGGGTSLCESFWRTTAVFSGEVLEIEDVESKNPKTARLPDRRRVVLRVDQVFRGAVPERLEVHTGTGGGDCGYPFRRGEKYLVFASEWQGSLSVTVCSPTRPLAIASKQITQITRSCVSQRPQLLVRGSVVRPNSRAARGVKVVLYSAEPGSNGEVVGSAVSNRRGEFSIGAAGGRRYLVVGSVGDERGEVGPFELTQATAPVLIVLRSQTSRP